MIWFVACALILLFSTSFIAIYLALELARTRSGYENIYQLLLRDRDAAREEVVTLRRALFPQLERMTADKPKTVTTPAAPSKNFTAPTPRIPFRLRFRQLVREYNTKQMGTDKLAQAIEESQPQPAAKEQA